MLKDRASAVVGGNCWDCRASDLGLEIGASANVHLLLLKADFVGSDTIACVLATNLHKAEVPTLLIDLGPTVKLSSATVTA